MRSMVRATEMRRMPAASEPKRRTAAPPLASCPKHAQRRELAQLALASDAPDRAHRVSESAPPATPPPSAHCDAHTVRTAPQRSPGSSASSANSALKRATRRSQPRRTPPDDYGTPAPPRCVDPPSTHTTRASPRNTRTATHLSLIELRQIRQKLSRDLVTPPNDARKPRQEFVVRQRLQTISVLPHPSRLPRTFLSS